MKATELGAVAIKEAGERAKLSSEQIQQVIMGCALPAGLGQAPARQAAIRAGLPLSTTAVTVNKMCGSGMMAVVMACDSILSGSSDLVAAGGMESMSGAPYLLAKHRAGSRIGHDTVIDHILLDGLEDAYSPGKLMGIFAEDAARAYQITRDEQDAYAIESLTRARHAQEVCSFDRETVPVEILTRAGTRIVSQDEQPAKADISKIPYLKPAFAADGTITPASSSSISDGAAALILTRASCAEKLGLDPIASIISHASHAHEPGLFTTAPIPAIQKVLSKANWTIDDVDLFEVNEAFAVVAMLAQRELAIPLDKLNVNGGACALGHPIGASGARILATLLGALETRKAKRGVAAICIGGGEATAMALELV